MQNKIILLSSIYDIRKRKEEELLYYTKQLEKLRTQMRNIQSEIDFTNYCIDMIEKEKIVNIGMPTEGNKNNENSS